MVRFRVVAVLLALAAVALGGTPAAAAPRAVTVAGGDTLNNAGSRCTLGFNVTGRGILAGRCGPVGTRWSAGTTSVGVVSTVFGGTGLTLITIDSPAVGQLHGIRNGAAVIAISSAAMSFVGQPVKEMSPVSGLHGGTTYSQPITPLLSQTGRAIF